MSIDTRQLIVFLCVLGLVTAAPVRVSGASLLLESRPTSVSITLDGDPTEWHDASTINLEHSPRSVSICHDQDNRYVMYQFSDRRLARQLPMRGTALVTEPLALIRYPRVLTLDEALHPVEPMNISAARTEHGRDRSQ